MKKVILHAMLCTITALAVLFTACTNLNNSSDSSDNPKPSSQKPSSNYIIDPNNPPLTLEAIDAGEINFTNPTTAINLKYKINDENIISVTDDTAIKVSTGDKVYLFAEGNRNVWNDGLNFTINCTSDCYVYGNVMSLLSKEYQTAKKITKNDAFSNLFWANTHIKNHPTNKIVLPATILTEYCYYNMFAGCTSLTEAPVLPATTLAPNCYTGMFVGCTSLTEAPILPASTLAPSCYLIMFAGCTSLDKVICLATDISAQSCTADWLSEVASTGTFIKASNNDWSIGASGIPKGWAVLDYDTMSVPLTFEAIAAGEINFTNLDRISNLKYSKNNGPLTDVVSSISVAENDIVSLFANGTSNDEYEHGEHFNINCTSSCYVYGNVMSLLTEDYENSSTISQPFALNCLFKNNKNINNHPSKDIVLPATTLTKGCYYYMFNGCTSLTKAPVLPSTTLTEYCYAYMFSGCTSLINAPVLPAKTMKSCCYAHMFSLCSKLSDAPALPAKSLASDCYWCMFDSCSSLTTIPELPATELEPSCYCNMFSGCSKLTNTPKLPAINMKYDCYWGMFSYCTSLTEAPELPATNLASECYERMFNGCTSLLSAPDLSATSLAYECYCEMFWNCTSLTTSPVLPATKLATSCYKGMFSGCTSLNKVECLATDISAEDCTKNWLNKVASTGTFIKKLDMDNWTIDENGIPANWNIQNK